MGQQAGETTIAQVLRRMACVTFGLWWGAQALAQQTDPRQGAGGCVDRPATTSSPAAPATRLNGVRYTCLPLPDGQALWVGEAGLPVAEGRPVVLLVHGLGNSGHRDWALTLPALTPTYHVVLVDLPGFGGSPAPRRPYEFATVAEQLAQVLDRVAPGNRAHVVGHSLGGAMSLYFAHRRPDKVERLVLVDAAGILLKPVFVQNIASLRRLNIGLAPLDRVLGIASDALNGLSRQVLLGMDERWDITPWLMRNPEVRAALLGGYTQVDAALHLVENDFSATIRETRAPTTLIWGRQDGVAPLRTGTLLAARLPDARLHVIDGVGHTPMIEAPAEFNRRLRAALLETRMPDPLAQPTEGGESQGDLTCRDTDRAAYTGRIGTLTLQRCTNVRIDDAHIDRLVVEGSSVAIERSLVDASRSGGVALSATGSDLVATAVTLRGPVGIRTDNSVLDLAGVSLRTQERGVEATGRPSRLFFSVSDWQGSDYRGDAHFIWPRAGAAVAP